MLALTLTQPWATLVAIGAKRIETRSWDTRYRGQIAIHSGRRFPAEAVALCSTEPFKSVLQTAGIRSVGALPRGAILCATELAACVTTESVRAELEAQELAFGDYADRRFAWRFMGEPIPLAQPIGVRGSLGLWQLPPDIRTLLDAALSEAAR